MSRKCPKCGSQETVKNGFCVYWSGGKKVRKQQFRCNDCGRQFRAKRGI